MRAKAKGNKPSPALRRALGRIACLNTALAASEDARKHETARLVEIQQLADDRKSQLDIIEESLGLFGREGQEPPPLAKRVEYLGRAYCSVAAHLLGALRRISELTARPSIPARPEPWKTEPREPNYIVADSQHAARFTREIQR